MYVLKVEVEGPAKMNVVFERIVLSWDKENLKEAILGFGFNAES